MAAPQTPDQLVGILRETVVALVRRDGPDLSARQLGVFLTCYLHDGGHTVRGLAADLNVSKPAITRALDRLGELDLARRKIDPLDRRSVLVQRTAQGAGLPARTALDSERIRHRSCARVAAPANPAAAPPAERCPAGSPSRPPRPSPRRSAHWPSFARHHLAGLVAERGADAGSAVEHVSSGIDHQPDPIRRAQCPAPGAGSEPLRNTVSAGRKAMGNQHAQMRDRAPVAMRSASTACAPPAIVRLPVPTAEDADIRQPVDRLGTPMQLIGV